MVDIYVDAIRSGRMTIEQVPVRWRQAVQDKLNGNTNQNNNEEEE